MWASEKNWRLRKACLGICEIQEEETDVQLHLAGDILVRSADEAFDLLLKPARLVA